MKRILLLFVTMAVVAGIDACSSIKLAVPAPADFIANATEMPVSGRQGVLIKQKVSFGEFSTGFVRYGAAITDPVESAGWYFASKGLSISSVQQSASFKQYEGGADSIEVICTAAMTSSTVNVSQSMSMQQVHSDKFTIILYHDGAEQSLDLSGAAPARFMGGRKEITVFLDYRFDAGKKEMFEGAIFEINAATVATANAVNQGAVWMRNDLDKPARLAIAGVATAVMLRPNLRVN